jgi:hypothetical protein
MPKAVKSTARKKNGTKTSATEENASTENQPELMPNAESQISENDSSPSPAPKKKRAVRKKRAAKKVMATDTGDKVEKEDSDSLSSKRTETASTESEVALPPAEASLPEPSDRTEDAMNAAPNKKEQTAEKSSDKAEPAADNDERSQDRDSVTHETAGGDAPARHHKDRHGKHSKKHKDKRKDKPAKTINISKLQSIPMAELNTMAKELEIENFGTMKKHELILEILQMQREVVSCLRRAFWKFYQKGLDSFAPEVTITYPVQKIFMSRHPRSDDSTCKRGILSQDRSGHLKKKSGFLPYCAWKQWIRRTQKKPRTRFILTI